jgi:hypothetical protein
MATVFALILNIDPALFDRKVADQLELYIIL